MPFFDSNLKSNYLQGVKNILIIGLILWSYTQTMGQMTIHPGDVPPLQPNNIIENVFLGNGVELFNTEYSGFDSSVGIFDNAQSSIGLEKGIVLTTGHSRNVNLPNSSNTLNGNTSGTSIVDEKLEALAGINVVDIAKFEIEFVPSSDLLSFRYVFASEEYPEFVCFGVNDVFGFFISGPKPGGGFYEGENIARIPNPNQPGEFLDLPVTVNSVNNGAPGGFADGGTCDKPNESLEFGQYYNENPENTVPAFNGFLDIFIAQATVIPCETYTIEIAIGDGGDRTIDSAVFLEGRSFSTRDLIVNINNPGIEGGLAEDCQTGSIDIAVAEPLPVDLPVELRVLTDPDLVNAATEGVDFEALPTNFNIRAGATSISVPLIPIGDNLAEGTEFIYLGLRRNICKVDTFILPLYDNVLTNVMIADTLMVCSDESFKLSADIGDVNTADVLEYISTESIDILTTMDAAQSTIVVSGLKDISLNPSIIAEICIDELEHRQLQDLDIFLKAPSGQILELSTDNGNSGGGTGMKQTCFTTEATQNINGGNPSESAGIAGDPNYTGNYLPEGSFDEWLSPITSELNGPYTLFIVDDTKTFDGQLGGWHITINPKYELDYNWSPRVGIDCPSCTETTGQIQSSQYYYLNLIDSYGCSYVDSTWVEVFDREQQPLLDCNQSAEGQVEISWPIDTGASYEFMVVGKDRWYSTDTPGSIVAGILHVDVLSKTNLIVSGMLASEPVTVNVRAVNRAGCNSAIASTTCTAIPCSTALPEIINVAINQPECSSQQTSRVVVNAQGSSDLQYVILLGANTAFNNDGVFRSIPSGTWPLRVSDANGCATEQMITINEAPKFELAPEIKEMACRNDNDARIELNITGDNAPFEINWNNDSDSDILDNLEGGNYSVTVTDAKGCTILETFEITNPVELISVYVQSGELDCNNENPDAIASIFSFGGRAPYVTTWNGTTTIDTLTNLRPGTLQWSVVDDRGCVFNGASEVTKSDGIELTFDNIKHLSCYNSNEGEATVIVENGVRDYIFIWSTGEETAVANNLISGVNSVTVTDGNGCIATSEIIIDGPEEILVSESIEQPNCAQTEDGQITLNISGGTGALSISWDDGSTDSTLSGIGPGNYCATITDDNGCELTRCYNVESKETLSVESTVTAVSCDPGSDGAITLQPTGGSGNYEYSWTGPNGFSSSNQNLTDLIAGIYVLTLIDTENSTCRTENIEFDLSIETDLTADLNTLNPYTCTDSPNGLIEVNVDGGETPYTYIWSDDSTAKTLANLSEGDYSVTVTDRNRCTVTAEMTITNNAVLSNDILKQDLNCPGTVDGSIEILTTGGNTPYTYEWNVPNINATLENIAAGEYKVTVTDAAGCDLQETIVLTEQFQALEINTIVENEKCYQNGDGQITVEIISGMPPVMFSLNDDEMHSNNTFSNLESGEYTLNIMDANGCISQQFLTIEAAAEVGIEIAGDLLVQYGEDVDLNVFIENASGEVQYIWSAPTITQFSCSDCSHPIISNVTESFSAQLVVIDENGCQKETFINIDVVIEMNLEVPTGFSPNGDGINDLLSIYGNPEMTIMNFTIYGRNGQKLYEGQDITPNEDTKGWDGRFQGETLPAGSYVWTIDYVDMRGEKGSTRGVTTLIK